jgi:hypothetical protein
VTEARQLHARTGVMEPLGVSDALTELVPVPLGLWLGLALALNEPDAVCRRKGTGPRRIRDDSASSEYERADCRARAPSRQLADASASWLKRATAAASVFNRRIAA